MSVKLLNGREKLMWSVGKRKNMCWILKPL